jgi:CRP-like cAMP-binding protein
MKQVEGEVSRRLYVVRHGEILLTAHNRAVESATKKTLVGVPDLLSNESDTASDSRLSATVGAEGARLLGWDHAALKAAIAEEVSGFLYFVIT